MEDKKFRLNKASSQLAVNEDTFDKINIESKSNPIPVGESNKVINLGEQFNKERQDSKLYRLTGTFDTLFTNVLFNSTGSNSWSTFNKNIFRDITTPPNTDPLATLLPEDLSFRDSILKHLKEVNGWFGYYDPDPSNASLCSWVDMEPKRELFSMAPKSSTKNWEVTITYPALLGQRSGDYNHPIVNGGLLIVDVSVSVIGNRNMLTFATPVKHGLSQGSSIILKGLKTTGGGAALSPYNGQYSVIRVGKDNGDDRDYNFSVDIGELVTIDNDSRMTRLVNGKPSEYYFRVFKKINTKGGNLIENDDYEIYPLAFGQTIYEDKAYQFVFNEDIDITDLTDNRNRPLSELYITVIKTDSGGVFTPVKSGVKTNLFFDSTNAGISEINRITNGPTTSNPLPDSDGGGVFIDDELFYGDVVEYNLFECKEIVLGDVYHRFNTVNRENGGSVGGEPLGKRYEGYMYKPHHKIQIREYSNYVEQGNFNTLDRPVYSNYNAVGDGRYLWRDLLDIGLNDTQETYLDYPFLNGCHYINTSVTLPLLRQDPFGYYGLQWFNSFPPDKAGTLVGDKIIVKNSQDVC